MPAVDLRGRRALVTGASKGIGHAIAKRLHIEAATLLATARTVRASDASCHNKIVCISMKTLMDHPNPMKKSRYERFAPHGVETDLDAPEGTPV
jgi:NAD(P)-dependent dehydrogenase (short-subunit alcohol dehydrogenase family)